MQNFCIVQTFDACFDLLMAFINAVADCYLLLPYFLTSTEPDANSDVCVVVQMRSRLPYAVECLFSMEEMILLSTKVEHSTFCTLLINYTYK